MGDFILKLTYGDINCSELLAMIYFKCSCLDTRQLNTFYVPFKHSKFSLKAALNRLMQLTIN